MVVVPREDEVDAAVARECLVVRLAHVRERDDEVDRVRRSAEQPREAGSGDAEVLEREAAHYFTSCPLYGSNVHDWTNV